jgi:hypothetical protein
VKVRRIDQRAARHDPDGSDRDPRRIHGPDDLVAPSNTDWYANGGPQGPGGQDDGDKDEDAGGDPGDEE